MEQAAHITLVTRPHRMQESIELLLIHVSAQIQGHLQAPVNMSIIYCEVLKPNIRLGLNKIAALGQMHCPHGQGEI